MIRLCDKGPHRGDTGDVCQSRCPIRDMHHAVVVSASRLIRAGRDVGKSREQSRHDERDVAAGDGGYPLSEGMVYADQRFARTSPITRTATCTISSFYAPQT